MKQTIKQPEFLSRLPETVKKKIQKVETQKLFELRLTETPLFVIKIPEGFYVLPYDRKIEDMNREKVKYVLGDHRCGRCANISNCPKVRDAFKDAAKKWCATNREAVRDSKRSEKYPFVKKCVELINSTDDFFIVASCDNFKVAKQNQVEENPATDEIWELRAAQAREAMEEERRRRIEGEQYYNYGYKPW